MIKGLCFLILSWLAAATATAQVPASQEFLIETYSIHIVQTDSGSTVTARKDDGLVFFLHSTDGFMDAIERVELNSDGLPDFFVKEKFCDQTGLIAIVSRTAYTFDKYYIADIHEADYCLDFQDKNRKDMELEDLNDDGYMEILFNHLLQEGKRIAVECSDTVDFKLTETFQ